MRLPGQAFIMAASAVLVACWAHTDSETHLLPAGFSGPVVIIYEDSASAEAMRDDGGAVLYSVPASGILRVQNPSPPAGFYEKSYFYQDERGRRTVIPSSDEEATPRVFGQVTGVTGSAPDEVRWQAYLVGDPDEIDQWGWLRGAHVADALGQPRPIRPRAK